LAGRRGSIMLDMPAQTLSSRPASNLSVDPVQQARTRQPRCRRRILVLLLLFLLPWVGSAVVLLFCPPVLMAMSAMFVKPQPGAIAWNGHDRISLVLMGLTQRTTEPARTDTLLVMDIDPARRHINMLSVPRDLWVNIPTYGHGKLAIAYAVGGPRLSAYTLERDLGIPVDYTLALTFRGFTKIVDAMGGVTINVTQELKDPTYPCLVGYDYCPIDIPAGTQHMDGATALEFVRERHAFAQQDLARVKDQQAFSDALKRTLLLPGTWPRFPAVLRTLTNSLITTLPLNAAPEVGAQYILAGKANVNHSYINIENGLVKPDTSPDGQSILTPTSSTAIPSLIHGLFADSTLAAENASVAVLNGTGTPGAAADVETTLQSMGFHTVMNGNADGSGYSQTQVIVNTAAGGGSALYTSRRLQRVLNAQLEQKSLPGQSAQIVVIVGSDLPVGSGSTGG